MQVSDLEKYMLQFAPLDLAESWDNVGLLVGSRDWSAGTMMTCLTLTPDIAEEAVKKNVKVIITHHPIMFRSIKQITDQTDEGKMLLKLIEHQIAVYSPHTAFDSTGQGINQQWADQLQLQSIQPIRPLEEAEEEVIPIRGSGRCGDLPTAQTVQDFLPKIQQIAGTNSLQFIGEADRTVRRIGIACGAAAEFLRDAQKLDCDLFLTGEARFHDCLAARSAGIAMVLVGHYGSERFACEKLAQILAEEFPAAKCFASESESDPVQNYPRI